jgi:hypothetical protein
MEISYNVNSKIQNLTRNEKYIGDSYDIREG